MIVTSDFENIKINNQVYLKPEYLIHPYVSGNKFRKLKYNLIEAKRLNKKTLLTFGGAYSNHIAAVASAGKNLGFHTIGIIRGEELTSKIEANPTLRFANSCGMQLKFISRQDYKLKTERNFIEKLNAEFGDFYCIPEGGTNDLAIKGCEEILLQADHEYDYICCSIGTGGTIAGLINAALPHQNVLGFPALKGNFLREEILKFAKNKNWQLITDYHFDGYGKTDAQLIAFINDFKKKYDIPLDPIYTGKMMFGIFDLIEKGFFPQNSKVLAIHTGGLQGIEGMNLKLKQQNKALIV
ncbi:MAG: pyridoxal-phosphate dependent enzyme [Psychroserpens sp.]|uniref:1-aminocyclopropane-1-carboxylate deaminase/D-cysteine desulfhydrase n=1 Tax=Psychroserpens sp. TaxID=2020870 RepID=UPI003C760D7A